MVNTSAHLISHNYIYTFSTLITWKLWIRSRFSVKKKKINCVRNIGIYIHTQCYNKDTWQTAASRQQFLVHVPTAQCPKSELWNSKQEKPVAFLLKKRSKKRSKNRQIIKSKLIFSLKKKLLSDFLKAEWKENPKTTAMGLLLFLCSTLKIPGETL